MFLPCVVMKARSRDLQPDITTSYNRLELSRITQGILNGQLTQLLLVTFLISSSLQALVGEVYPSVLDDPSSALRE